jgi:hypothetical protein
MVIPLQAMAANQATGLQHGIGSLPSNIVLPALEPSLPGAGGIAGMAIPSTAQLLGGSQDFSLPIAAGGGGGITQAPLRGGGTSGVSPGVTQAGEFFREFLPASAAARTINAENARLDALEQQLTPPALTPLPEGQPSPERAPRVGPLAPLDRAPQVGPLAPPERAPRIAPPQGLAPTLPGQQQSQVQPGQQQQQRSPRVSPFQMLSPQVRAFQFQRLDQRRRHIVGGQLNQTEQEVYKALESGNFDTARQAIGKAFQMGVLAPELMTRVDNLNKLIDDRQRLRGKRDGQIALLKPHVLMPDGSPNLNANPGLTAYYGMLTSKQVPDYAIDAFNDETMSQVMSATTARQAHEYIDRAITTYTHTASGTTTIEQLGQQPGQPGQPGQQPPAQQPGTQPGQPLQPGQPGQPLPGQPLPTQPGAQPVPRQPGAQQPAQPGAPQTQRTDPLGTQRMLKQKEQEAIATRRGGITAETTTQPLYAARPGFVPHARNGEPRQDLTWQTVPQLQEQNLVILPPEISQQVTSGKDALDALDGLSAFYEVVSGDKAISQGALDRLRRAFGLGLEGLSPAVMGAIGAMIGAGRGRLGGGVGAAVGTAIPGITVGVPEFLRETETQAEVARALLTKALEDAGVLSEREVQRMQRTLEGLTWNKPENVLAAAQVLRTRLQSRIERHLATPSVAPTEGKPGVPPGIPTQDPRQPGPLLPTPQQTPQPAQPGPRSQRSPDQPGVWTAAQQGIRSQVAAAAQRQGVPVPLALALARHESNFTPQARSGKGAIGVMQLMPATAKSLGVNPQDTAQNITGGVAYLKQQLDRFGSPTLAVAAYNAGPGRVQKAQGVPRIAETQAFVQRVLGSMPVEQQAATPDMTRFALQEGPSGAALPMADTAFPAPPMLASGPSGSPLTAAGAPPLLSAEDTAPPLEVTGIGAPPQLAMAAAPQAAPPQSLARPDSQAMTAPFPTVDRQATPIPGMGTPALAQPMQSPAMQQTAQQVFSRLAPGLGERSTAQLATALQQSPDGGAMSQAVSNALLTSLTEASQALSPLADVAQPLSQAVGIARSALQGGQPSGITSPLQAIDRQMSQRFSAQSSHTGRGRLIQNLLASRDPGMQRLVRQSLQGATPLERSIGLAYQSDTPEAALTQLSHAATPQAVSTASEHLWERFALGMRQAVMAQVQGLIKADLSGSLVAQALRQTGEGWQEHLAQQLPTLLPQLTQLGSLIGGMQQTAQQATQVQPVSRQATRELAHV